jgi:geranylgeranyl pyrophosphate synthase
VKPADILSWRSAAQRRRVATGLAAVESRLTRVVSAVPGRLAEAGEATLSAGGKRLRPLLVLLAARNTGPLDEPVLRAATAVELLHMATLVHDDVLDGAELRRGLPTVARKYGDEMAVSTGNYLLAQAFSELAGTDDAAAVAALAEVAWGLSEGERLQADDAFRTTVTVDEYVRRCRLKTADLFAVACRLGAHMTGLSDETVAALAAFGDSLGLSFQMLDDILDLTGDEAVTGKRRGADLRDGTVTLPIVLALEARPDLGPRLLTCRDNETCLESVVEDVLASGSIERARQMALAFIDEARSRLAGCPGGFERELLDELAGSMVDRYG